MKKIKNFKNILFLLLFTIVITGCNEKLELANPTQLPVDKYITSDESAQTAVANVYNEMQNSYVNAARYRMFTGLYADELDHTGSFPDLTQSVVNDVLASNYFITRIFSNTYDVINNSSIIIRNLSTNDDVSPATKQSLTAECHALRAFGYFHLVKLYGGLPIVEDIYTIDTKKDTPRSSEADVYKYILNEVSKAKGKISNVQTTRFTNDALTLLEAEVHIFMGNYNLAEPLLKSLVGKYTLTSDYADLFKVGNTSTSTIFRLNYTSSDGNNLAFFFTPTGRKEVGPSATLLNAFEADDKRKELIGIASNNSPYINKYTDNAGESDLPYIYRYADVLLMYAEVLARKNDANASKYINMIRKRAGLTDVTLNSSNVVDLISKERFVEFFAEGKRWTDVKRLGLAPSVIGGKTGVTYNANKLLLPIPQDEIDSNDSISQENQNPGY